MTTDANVRLRRSDRASGTRIPNDLPRISCARWLEVAERARRESVPILIEGVFSDSEAVRTWSLESFAERFGDLEVPVTVALPEKRSPYLESHNPHGKRMTVDELIKRLREGERCYLNQASLSHFGTLGNEINLSLIAVPPIYSVNLWIGGRTRSGLHYDSADNFLIQVFGIKHAILVAPTYGRSLRLVRDNPSKSDLSPDEIEGITESCFSQVTKWRSTLRPGDALYIPRGWWHYLASGDLSISMNVWHGDRLEFKQYCIAFLRTGPAVWMRTVRDFALCGALHRPYEQRLFSPPPLGVSLYSRVTNHGRR